MKRVCISFLFFILVSSLISSAALSAHNNEIKAEMILIQQLHAIALQKNVVVQEEIKKYNLEDNYAGAFIDDNGELNINLVSNVNEVKTKINQEGVHYHQVKHSYKTLNETMTTLEDKMPDLEITKLSLDEKNNKVIITVRDLDDGKISKINQYVNPETVEYENAVGEITLTADILNGTSLDLGLTVGGLDLTLTMFVCHSPLSGPRSP